MRIYLCQKVKRIGMVVIGACGLLVGATEAQADRVDLNLFAISPGTSLGSGVDYWVDVVEDAARDRYDFTVHNDSDPGNGSSITGIYFHRDLTDSGVLLSQRGVNNSTGTDFSSGATPAAPFGGDALGWVSAYSFGAPSVGDGIGAGESMMVFIKRGTGGLSALLSALLSTDSGIAIHVAGLANEGQLGAATGIASSVSIKTVPAPLAATAGLVLLSSLAAAGCRRRREGRRQ